MFELQKFRINADTLDGSALFFKKKKMNETKSEISKYLTWFLYDILHTVFGRISRAH